MQVTIPQTTVTVPGPAALLRSWRWALLALLAALIMVWPGTGRISAVGSSTSPDTVGDVGQMNSLALDGSGNPVVSYYDQTNGDLKVLHCNDKKCTGGNESITSPDTAGNVGVSTSLALDASGNPVVSYGFQSGGVLRVLHCNDANCAGGDESITSPYGASAAFTSLALDGSGNPVVSFYNVGGGDLLILHCNDANCAGGDESITSPDTVGVVGYSTSLALDGGGNPVVSYYDATNFDLKVLHCNDANCDPSAVPGNGPESITSPDTAGDVGRFTSLALDGVGRPVVSYMSFGGGWHLKVLHCNDANCAGGDESITSPGKDAAGGDTSLSLDAAGRPVVSYHLGLSVLHCNDANCAGGDESNVTADDVGEYSSLALDKNGNPVVSYAAGSNADLKVLHCNYPDCSSSARKGIIISNVGQYALPKTCFEVRDATQTPLFQVCDDDFQGTPDNDAACIPDGVCDDENPAQGAINVNVTPADYRIVETQAAPQHTADPAKLVCDTAVAPCVIIFTNSPNTRPWHPWDIVGAGAGGLEPDGFVRVNDILAVVQHYFDDKPLP